ncbi:hypothetical protein H632_c1494p0, partial [Helicosporidium sp. ATCC 50920]
MKERGEIDVVVRLPRNPKLFSTHDCYNVDYPTHSAHLGSAEIVLDLNGQPDADNVSNIIDFSVSPHDKNIAFVCSTNTTTNLELSVQSLVKRGPPTRLTELYEHLITWDKGDRFFYYSEKGFFETKLVMQHNIGIENDKAIFKMFKSVGDFILSGSKTYYFFADAQLRKSRVMVGRRKDAVWHPIFEVPRYTQFWMDELDEGVVLGTEDPSTGNRSFVSYIPNDTLNRLLQGDLQRDENVQQLFEHNTLSQDVATTANG